MSCRIFLEPITPRNLTVAAQSACRCFPRPSVKSTACAVIAGYRLPQIVGTVGVSKFVRLLGRVAHTGEIPVRQLGYDFVSHDRFDCREADRDLTSGVMGGPDDRFGGDLGLIN